MVLYTNYHVIGCAIWFTFKTRFVQFRMIKEMIKLLGDSTGKLKNENISFFSGICRIAGQPCRNRQSGGSSYGNCGCASGAVFWMWIIALLGASSAFVESTLAHYIKEEEKISEPAYYMERGLGLRWMGVFCCIDFYHFRLCLQFGTK